MVKHVRGFAFFIVGLALFATTTQNGHGKGLPLIELPVKPPAPAMQLQEYEGEAFDLAKVSGRVVVATWATWCAPCLKEMPALEAAWKTLQKEDVLLVGVNLGDTIAKD